MSGLNGGPRPQSQVSLLEKLLKEQSSVLKSMNEKMSSMQSEMTEMKGEIVSLKTEIQTYKNSFSPPPSPNHAVTDVAALTYAAVVAARIDEEQIAEKAKRVVCIGLPEGPNSVVTATSDDKFVRDLISELNIPELASALDSGTITHHRHPQNLAAPDKTASLRRPIKISLPSASLRTQFLNRIRERRPSALKPYAGSYCRRDLTSVELQLERDAKKKARELNQAAGEVQYGVRDVSVYRTSSLTPLSSSATPSHLVDFPTPSAFRIVDIGGIVVSPGDGNLNKTWSDILDLRPQPVLLSFGSFAKAHLMPDEYKRTIRNTFAKFPDVTFIWKYEKPEHRVSGDVPNII